MELKMNQLAAPAITFNYDELKAELQERTQLYTNLIYSETQIKEAKADRAKLNKLRTALEDARKQVKKDCLKPYDEFAAQVAELVGIIDEPITLIDEQTRKFEEKEKEDKRLRILQMWKDIDKPQWLMFEKIWNDKWLNKTVSTAKIQADIEEAIAKVRSDCQTIGRMEFAHEALAVYKEKLDLNAAISEGQRMLDIQKQKEEMQRRKAEEQKAEQEAEPPQTAEEPKETAEEPIEEDSRKWYGFKAYMDREEVKMLAEFCRINEIHIESWKGDR